MPIYIGILRAVPLWVVVDGAYVKRPFLARAKRARVTVVSRLRKDAALASVPRPPKRPRPGAPRKYGGQCPSGT